MRDEVSIFTSFEHDFDVHSLPQEPQIYLASVGDKLSVAERSVGKRNRASLSPFVLGCYTAAFPM
jgi:hypothetical protein